MALHFITGNKGKFAEVKVYIPDLVQLDIELPEIQELDPHKILQTKLDEAAHHHKDELIVDDTSLSLVCLNGMPGPLIKWFLKAFGNKGLYDLTVKLGNTKAIASTVIGYSNNGGKPQFFEGSISGTIVEPQGPQGFGWDPIFQPDGYDQTFAQMWQEKNLISMRKIAVLKLKEYLLLRDKL